MRFYNFRTSVFIVGLTLLAEIGTLPANAQLLNHKETSLKNDAKISTTLIAKIVSAGGGGGGTQRTDEKKRFQVWEKWYQNRQRNTVRQLTPVKPAPRLKLNVPGVPAEGVEGIRGDFRGGGGYSGSSSGLGGGAGRTMSHPVNVP